MIGPLDNLHESRKGVWVKHSSTLDSTQYIKCSGQTWSLAKERPGEKKINLNCVETPGVVVTGEILSVRILQ